MSSSKIPFTVVYKKSGTAPPLFLAGSFSDPEWEPKEMEYTTDEDGEHTFRSDVMVEADKEYQFKLRVGQGDWWVLSEDHETATDDSGNKNNVLTVPNSRVEHGDEKAAIEDAKTEDVKVEDVKTEDAKIEDTEIEDTEIEDAKIEDTKTEDVKADDAKTEDAKIEDAKIKDAKTEDAKIEDTEIEDAKIEEAKTEDAKINQVTAKDATPKDESVPSVPIVSEPEEQVPTLDESKLEPDDLKAPLFAHECLGAYNFAEDESEEDYPSIPMRRYVESKSADYSDVDLNDPTIEKFPSDRNSIIDAIRTIQTQLSQDQAHLEDIPASPRVVSGGRASIDSSEDMILSPVALGSGNSRRRDQRLSHSSFGRSKSAVSLGSIAEEDAKEPESADEDLSPGQVSPINKGQDPPPVVTLPNPNTSDFEERPWPASEEDEAVAMKSSKAAAEGRAGKMTPASIRDDLVQGELSRELEVSATDASEKGTEAGVQRQTVDLSKAPLEPSNLSEAGSLDSDSDLAFPSMAPGDEKTETKPRRSDASKRHATVSIWLRMLLARVRHNKLRMILATSAVAVAMGLRWWTGSEVDASSVA